MDVSRHEWTAFVIAGFLGATACYAADASSAADVLEKMSRQARETETLQADAKVVMISPVGSMTGTGRLIRGGSTDDRAGAPKHFINLSMTVDLGERKLTTTTTSVSDGEFTWQETKNSASPEIQVVKTKVAGPQDARQTGSLLQLGGGLDEIRKQFDVTLLREETIDGQKMHVLEGVWRPDYLKQNPEAAEAQKLLAKIKWYVGEDDLLVHRVIRTNPEGKDFQTIDLKNIKVNEKIDAAVFRYIPPPGAKIIDLTQGK